MKQMVAVYIHICIYIYIYIYISAMHNEEDRLLISCVQWLTACNDNVALNYVSSLKTFVFHWSIKEYNELRYSFM